jgi:hypothetical protein
MTDRNTTVVTDSGGGMVIGIVLAALIVLGFLVLAFGWPFSISGRSADSGPTINIQAPSPAPAPALPATPAPAPAPAPAR